MSSLSSVHRKGGGYNVRQANISRKGRTPLVKTERDALTCTSCNWLLRNPVQLISCGCRFCQSCLEDIVISSVKDLQSIIPRMKCPADDIIFTLADRRKDKSIQKELNSLKVSCPTEPEPCSWHGSLADIQKHEENHCPNVIVQCESKCGESFPRSQKEAHDAHCLKREEPCEHCGIPVVRDECQKHLDYDCSELEMHCPFTEYESQCAVKAKKLEMAEHVKENHLIASIEQVGSLKKDVSSLKSENELLKMEMKRRDEILTQFERQLKSGNDHLLTEMKRRDDIITQLEKRLREVEVFKGQRYHSDFVESDSGATGRKPTRQQQAFTNGGMCDGFSSATVGKLREEMDTSHHISQLNDTMQTIQSAFTHFGVMVDEVRLRQDFLDVKTTTGVFVWKIPDIRRRYGDAIKRRTLSLYSPPFYVCPHGYRMCIRTSLNGDGVGKGSHNSPFFVLMKSEHDNQLPLWYGDAIERRTLSLYSPPFYACPHGCRMCIRMSGDGVGNGSHNSPFFVLMKSEHDNQLPLWYGDAIERRKLSLYSPPFYVCPHKMCFRMYKNKKGFHTSLLINNYQ